MVAPGQGDNCHWRGQGGDRDEAVGGAVADIPRNESECLQKAQGEAGKDSSSVEDGGDVGGTDQTEHDHNGAMNDPAVVEAMCAYNQARDAHR